MLSVMEWTFTYFLGVGANVSRRCGRSSAASGTPAGEPELQARSPAARATSSACPSVSLHAGGASGPVFSCTKSLVSDVGPALLSLRWGFLFNDRGFTSRSFIWSIFRLTPPYSFVTFSKVLSRFQRPLCPPQPASTLGTCVISRPSGEMGHLWQGGQQKSWGGEPPCSGATSKTRERGGGAEGKRGRKVRLKEKKEKKPDRQKARDKMIETSADTSRVTINVDRLNPLGKVRDRRTGKQTARL